MGIALLKYSKASKVNFSDYQDLILENLKKNLITNQINHTHKKSIDYEKETEDKEENLNLCPLCFNRYEIINLDWRNFEKIEESYDLIVGAELIYQGGHIEELVKLIEKTLKKGYFIINI